MTDLLGEYQQEVMLRMANPDGCEAPPLAIFGLGIAGEAGEVADLLKKYLGHGHRLELEKLAKELGDVLWYVTAIGLSVGLPLEKVIELNIAKIKARHPKGFTHATAQAKADEAAPPMPHLAEALGQLKSQPDRAELLQAAAAVIPGATVNGTTIHLPDGIDRSSPDVARALGLADLATIGAKVVKNRYAYLPEGG